MDIVQIFASFSELSVEEKLKIKENGRPLPDMKIQFQGNSRGKQYVRKFHREIYSRNRWICGCKIKNSFFCFPCILFGGDSKWTKSGVNDLVHLTDRIKTHDNSKQHILNEMHLALLGTTNIQAQLDSAFWLDIQRHNAHVTKNRHILSKIIDCIKFCGAFELALHGHDSKNPGVFLGLINFASEIDKTLQEHLQSDTVFKSTSKDIQNDLLNCMLDVYYEEIKKEIASAPFVAVMADETTDVSSKFQMSIVLRYVKNANPVERFWGFLCPSDPDAQALTDGILSVIDPLIDQNFDKLVGQSYDGAAAVGAKDKKIQANIKAKYPNAHFVHCYAHQLDGIMAQASSQCNQVRLFFSNIQDVPDFFSNSPERVALLDAIVGGKIARSVPTWWDFESRVVNVVFEYREELIECMEAIEEGKLGTNIILINQAMSIKRMLQDGRFIFWLTFFQYIMPHVDVLFEELQRRKVDPVELKNAVECFTASMNKIKETKISEVKEEVEEGVSLELEDQIPKRRRTEAEHENNRAAALEVCDVIIDVAKERFAFSGHLVAASLFFSEKFSEYNIDFPERELTTAVAAYSMLDKQRLKTELSVIYMREEYKSITGATSLLNFLISNNLEDALREVKKLLEIIVTVPMITTEAERTFSTLNRIKTFLRNSMCQDRLTALAVLSIESEFVKTIPSFNEKVMDNFANKTNHRMDLLYKNIKIH
jgi:hypothetical protein